MRASCLLLLGLAATAGTAPSVARAQCSGTVDNRLTDLGGFVWDITTQGAILNGSIDAYDGGFNLQVGGVYFPASAMSMELGGRQIVHGPATMSGLTVVRKVYIPSDDSWARFVDFFTNPGAATVTVQVRIDTNVGSDGSTVITASQSGDTTFTTADRWVNTDDGDTTGDPSLNHNFWGDGAMVTPSAVSMTTFSCAGTQGPIVTYDLTIPGGATMAIMTFAGQNSNRAGSNSKAMALDMLPMTSLVGLTVAEQTQIVNWRSVCDTMDRDGDGVSCVAGDCNDGNAMIRPGATEVCNAVDDNCAGGVDEGFMVGTACSVGVGFCMRSGTNRCNAAGTGVECSVMPGMPRAEVCNGIDDDCDGLNDLDEPGLVMPESCNGVDDDCDTRVDETWPTRGMACTAGVGFCSRTGSLRCNAAGTDVECSAVPGAPRMEVCNGIDDDCDGLGDLMEPGLIMPESCNGVDDDCDTAVDETWPTRGMACTAGVGFCTASGVVRCNTAGTDVECSAVPGMPRMEVCNGIDDDCDGLGDLMEPGLVVPESCNGADDDCDMRVDETWPTLGMGCMSGLGFCAVSGTERCTPDGTGTECSAMPGTPRTDVCNGIDDDCDGVADGDEMGLCDTSASGPVCIPVTPTASRCGCLADGDCGAADSGRICDTASSRCASGCAVGPGRNGCMAGRFCTVEVEGMNGTCTATCNFDSQCAATMPDRPLCLRPTGGPGPTNRCVACTDDASCAAFEGRPICNAGECVECTATRPEACATSEGGPICLESGACGCLTDADCPDGFCHGTMRVCTTRPDAGPPPSDAGPIGVDAGMADDDPPRREGGCGCEVPAERTSTPLGLGLGVLGVALLLARARRRR